MKRHEIQKNIEKHYFKKIETSETVRFMRTRDLPASLLLGMRDRQHELCDSHPYCLRVGLAYFLIRKDELRLFLPSRTPTGTRIKYPEQLTTGSVLAILNKTKKVKPFRVTLIEGTGIPMAIRFNTSTAEDVHAEDTEKDNER